MSGNKQMITAFFRYSEVGRKGCVAGDPTSVQSSTGQEAHVEASVVSSPSTRTQELRENTTCCCFWYSAAGAPLAKTSATIGP